MALFRCVVSVLDADGQTGTFTLNTSAADMATAVTRFQGAVEAADNLMMGKITNVAISQEVDFSAWSVKPNVIANADREVKGRWVMGTAGGWKTRISLPTFDKNTYTVVGGNIKLPADDTDIFAFEATAVIGAGALTDERGDDITSRIAAYEAFGNK